MRGKTHADERTDAAAHYPDVSDTDGRFAVVTEGRIERRFWTRAEAEHYIDELDEWHQEAEMIDTERGGN